MYFKSKSELYRATIEEKLNIESLENVFQSISYDEKPSLQISKVSIDLMSVVLKLDKPMIQEYINSFFRSDLDESNLIYKIIIDTDNTLKINYNEILKKYKYAGVLKDSFDVSICSDIIFNTLLASFYKYISMDNPVESELLSNLEKKLSFVITPYEK